MSYSNTDILMNDVFDLVFSQGDLVVAEANEQHIAAILDANKGVFIRRPTLGADLFKFLDAPENSILSIENTIKNELVKDIFLLKELNINGSDIEVVDVQLKNVSDVL